MATPLIGTGVHGVRTVARHAGAWVIGLGRSAWLFPLDRVQVRRTAVRLAQAHCSDAHRRRSWSGLGQLRAERAAWRAAKGVPAYRDYLEEHARRRR